MMNKYVIFTVSAVSFLLGIGFYHFFLRTDCIVVGKTTKVNVETKVEWITKDTTIVNYITKEVLYKSSPRPEEESLQVDYDSLRVYKGINHVLYGSIDWEVVIGGKLQSITLNPSFKIPVVNTITRVNEKTTVQKESPKLFATATYLNKSISPGVTYVKKNLLAGYNYNLLAQSHAFTVGLKIK